MTLTVILLTQLEYALNAHIDTTLTKIIFALKSEICAQHGIRLLESALAVILVIKLLMVHVFNLETLNPTITQIQTQQTTQTQIQVWIKTAKHSMQIMHALNVNSDFSLKQILEFVQK